MSLSKNLFQLLILGAVIFSQLTFGLDVFANKSDLIISEVGFMGSTTGKGHDKWIEIFNPTSDPINLSGYFIKSSNPRVLPQQLNGQIASGGTFVITTSRNGTSSLFDIIGGSNQKIGWSTMTSISNTSTNKYINVTLLKGSYPISSIYYGTNFVDNIMSNFGENRGSIECNQFGNCWASSSQFFAGNFGTPGVVSYITVSQPTPAEPEPVSAPTVDQPIISKPEPSTQIANNISEPSANLNPNTETAKQIISDPILEKSPQKSLEVNTQIENTLPTLAEKETQQAVQKNSITSTNPITVLNTESTTQSNFAQNATTKIQLENAIKGASRTINTANANNIFTSDLVSTKNKVVSSPFVSVTKQIDELNLSSVDYFDIVILLVVGLYFEFKKFNFRNLISNTKIIDNRA